MSRTRPHMLYCVLHACKHISLLPSAGTDGFAYLAAPLWSHSWLPLVAPLWLRSWLHRCGYVVGLHRCGHDVRSGHVVGCTAVFT